MVPGGGRTVVDECMSWPYKGGSKHWDDFFFLPLSQHVLRQIQILQKELETTFTGSTKLWFQIALK